MNHADAIAAERRIFREELDRAAPYLAGRTIRERLALARGVESIVRLRCGLEPLSPVSPIPTT